MSVRKVKPRNIRRIEHVRYHLQRFHNVPARQPEASHPRLLPPRHSLVSDTETAVIRAAFGGWPSDESSFPGWIRDSVILWARECIQFEVANGRQLGVEADDARAIEALGYVSAPVSSGGNPVVDGHTSTKVDLV